MPASTSKPKKANVGPWVNPVDRAGDIKLPTKSGITPAEFAEREERFYYLKRKGKTFHDDP